MNNFAAQGGNTDADSEAMRHVAELVTTVQGDDTMVLRFVLIVETLEADDRFISSFTSPGLKEWDSIGLLQWAINCEGNAALSDDDEDDE